MNRVAIRVISRLLDVVIEQIEAIAWDTLHIENGDYQSAVNNLRKAAKYCRDSKWVITDLLDEA